LRWDIARQQATVLDRLEKEVAGWLIVSPDERWLARLKERRLEVKAVSGAAWTQLIRPMNGGQFDIAPDGNWIYFHGGGSYGENGFFRVAISGGLPERLGDFPVQSNSGTMRLSPDGAKVIASVFDSSNGFEIWSLENFIPAEAKR
jgi:hypothetical protein